MRHRRESMGDWTKDANFEEESEECERNTFEMGMNLLIMLGTH